MRAPAHGDVVAHVNGVESRVLTGYAGVDLALALLDDAEEAAGVPLVDESERARLTELARGLEARGHHWHSLLARDGDEAVGYAGMIRRDNGHVDADVAVLRELDQCDAALQSLLVACDVLARRHEATRLRAWLRHARDRDMQCATAVGFSIERRLGVFALDDLAGHLAADTTPTAAEAGITIRPFTDDEADVVVDVLAAAYDGTPDGGWTRGDLAHRQNYDWFDPADLLVAHDGDTVVGLHWTKQRGEGVGEVYNLAVAPDQQGRRLGAVLLRAGLEHLAGRGCDRVMLWVDLANERAVRLYAAHGFRLQWEDVAFSRVTAT